MFDYRLQQQMAYSLEVSVSSSGFDIAPAQNIKREANVSLPAELIWTISPKRTSDHQILVEVIRAFGLQGYKKNAILTVNDSTTTISEQRPIPFPIKVLTPWGISSQLQGVIQAIVGLIGFVLSLPFLVKAVIWIIRLIRVAT